MDDDYLDVEQVQELLGVSKPTVWNLLKRYDLARYRIPARGKKTLIRKSELLEAMNRPVPVRKRPMPSDTPGKLIAAA
jgi:excisionase family DNA binding protein